MSSSVEVPDIVGTITNAIGLNRLWESDEQLDAEKRKSEQKAEPAKTEPTPIERRPDDDEPRSKPDVAPVSIDKERENGQAGARADVDPDGGIDGIKEKLRDRPKKRTGFEWPMPASVKTNQAKKKVDSEPTKDDGPTPPTDEDPETTTDGAPSKASFMASIPFLTQQHDQEPPETAEETTEDVPADSPATATRPRPHTSSSHQHSRPRPGTRQYTMPTRLAHGSDDADTGKRSAARSRWVAATQGLRFPLRRKKTEKQVAATKGNEVMMSLMAAAPAATMVGTHLVPDERGHHRIPIITELLKVRPPKGFHVYR
jgi:hypothetical protein